MQLELFTTDIAEIEYDNVRYILRLNPERRAEIRVNRAEKIATLEKYITQQNDYLLAHNKAKVDVALTRCEAKLTKLKIGGFCSLKINDRTISLEIDKISQAEIEQLDGCYCIKSNVDSTAASAKTIHDRYKSLKHVEYAFRTMKQGHLEVRPVYVRKYSRTDGHVLVVMLAYRLIYELNKVWASVDMTVEQGLASLSTICITKISTEDSQMFRIPTPSKENQELLKLLGVELPSIWSQKMKAPTKKLAA